MKNNKKGAALMQVLLMTMILAGITTMLLRVTLSRSSSARQTRRAASAEVLIQSCMAEVNSLWSSKTPAAFKRDMAGHATNGPYMYCKSVNTSSGACTDPAYDYTCTYNNSGYGDYKVVAKFQQDSNEVWRLVYEVDKDSTKVL